MLTAKKAIVANTKTTSIMVHFLSYLVPIQRSDLSAQSYKKQPAKKRIVSVI
jgi:hypothetical protein